MATNSEVKQVTAYEYAGELYKEQEDAQKAEALILLRKFLDETLSVANSKTEILEWCQVHFEKIITHLNRFY